ncbi:putative signal transducing protein [Hydrogenophaga sp.]|uniref:putative signal transducing protein n=1 Tax=Hydrogenophaga sp. TaxID=1904254 RepID=UPI003D0FB1B5
MTDGNSDYDPELGDWRTLVTFFSPTEAFLLRGCLQAGGVPAAVADAHLVQTHTLLAGAIPVRVLVPESRFAEAEAVVSAFQRGDFSLEDTDEQDDET